MPILLPFSAEILDVDRRRYPAILAEVPSSAQSDEERDRAFLRNLIETAELSSYHQLEQTYVALTDELLQLRALERGWDTYQADPPSEASVQTARRVLLTLKRLGALPTAVRPSSDGGVGICFTSGDSYGHMELLNGGEAYALAYSPTQPPRSWNIDTTDAAVRAAWEQMRAYLQP